MRLLALGIALTLAATAHAGDDPDEGKMGQGKLKGSRLFLNQTMRQDIDRTFGVGLVFGIAPVKAAEKALVNEFEKAYPAESKAVMEAAKFVKVEDLQGLNAAGLKQKLSAVPQLTADQKAAIQNLPISDSDTAMTAQLVRIMQDPVRTITYTIEPFAEFRFKWIDLVLSVPLAGFGGNGENKFALGNIGIDLKSGISWGKGIRGGLSYGLTTWLPTGTDGSNALGMANLYWSPKYLHEYLTTTLYLAAGIDLMYVLLQANVAYNGMFGVRDSPVDSSIHFIQFGAGLSITAIPYIILSAELSGMKNFKDNAAFDLLFITAGLRFSSTYVDVGLAAQFPLTKKDPSAYGAVSNLQFGSPSDFNILLTAAFGF